MPRAAYQRMLPYLEQVQLEDGQVLYEPKGEIDYVYFPVGCLVSLLTAVDKERTLEVGMVGNEGMVGMPLALGVGGARAGAGWRYCNAHHRGAFPHRVQEKPAVAESDFPLQPFVDGAGFADRRLQPFS